MGADHSDVGWIIHALGLAHMGLGENETGRPYLERSLEIFEKQLGHDHWSVAFPVTRLAVADRLAGDNEAARERFERALEVR